MIQRVSIIGWGRLAQHLSLRLERIGVEIVSVHSRSKANLETALIPSDVDAYLVAVSDDAIEKVAAILPQGPIRVHHAGSVPLSHMGCSTSNCGVIWPPQTFGQIEQTVDWSAVPIAVQSDNAAVVALARALSPIAFEVTETQRMALHLGAVLAGNLTAAWLGQVSAYCAAEGLPFEALHPLVRQSVEQALATNALPSGPAARGDRSVLESQQAKLASNPELQQLYRTLTNAILAQHGQDPL